MAKIKNEKGNTYGRLTVVDYYGTDKHNKAQWYCLCECGKGTVAIGAELRSGHTKSCGCLRPKATGESNRQTKVKHGVANQPLYNVWKKMINRCCDSSNKNYHQYGGRGITVCPEWANDPAAFVKWGLKNGYKKGLQIDRRDNGRGYAPENCRFTTSKTNNRNRRDNVVITALGESKTQAEWAEVLGVHFTTLLRHRKRGDVEQFVKGRLFESEEKRAI